MSERAGHYAGREQVIASLLWSVLDRVSCHPHRGGAQPWAHTLSFWPKWLSRDQSGRRLVHCSSRCTRRVDVADFSCVSGITHSRDFGAGSDDHRSRLSAGAVTNLDKGAKRLI